MSAVKIFVLEETNGPSAMVPHEYRDIYTGDTLAQVLASEGAARTLDIVRCAEVAGHTRLFLLTSTNGPGPCCANPGAGQGSYAFLRVFNELGTGLAGSGTDSGRLWISQVDPNAGEINVMTTYASLSLTQALAPLNPIGGAAPSLVDMQVHHENGRTRIVLLSDLPGF